MTGLPREARLSGGDTYLRLFRTGRRFRTTYFNVFIAGGRTSATRLGIAVSKRMVARAVNRNRIKRIIRETFRSNSQRLGGSDLIVQVNAPAGRASSESLFLALRELCDQVVQTLDPINRPT